MSGAGAKRHTFKSEAVLSAWEPAGSAWPGKAAALLSPSSAISSRLAILPVEVAPPASTGLSIRRRLIRWFHGADKARDEAKYNMAFTIEHQPLDIETAARRAHG